MATMPCERRLYQAAIMTDWRRGSGWDGMGSGLASAMVLGRRRGVPPTAFPPKKKLVFLCLGVKDNCC